MILEPPRSPATTLARYFQDLRPLHAVAGLVAFIFAASGPLAVILTVGSKGGLSQIELESWIFGAFFFNGLVSLLFCWLYRQPLVFFWTIPGTVLVGPALAHLSFAEVVGAFYATGLLLLVLGLSGWVRRAMALLPMPIVMGMVAGVFLQFGLGWIQAFDNAFWIAAPMSAAFLIVTGLPALSRRVPPLIAALVVGALAVWWLDAFAPKGALSVALAAPQLVAPAFSLRAMIELVFPLAITVLVIQNAQGVAVLDAAGHKAPINAVTFACGLTSLACAAVGCVSTCLTGPANAIIAADGRLERHYTGGVVTALLALIFALLAPAVTALMLAAPPAFIACLAGLAMLKILQNAFTISFSQRHTLGALVAFLVSVADIPILAIGAPFWGLVFGYAISRLLERGDFGRQT